MAPRAALKQPDQTSGYAKPSPSGPRHPAHPPAQPVSPPRDSLVEAEAAYRRWRFRAADVMLIVIALSILPQNITWLLGYDLPPKGLWFPLTLVMLMLAVAASIMRRLPSAVRVWLLLVAMYIGSIHGLLWYSGAMARVWLAGAPVLALILVGPRSALVTALVSVALITFHAADALLGVTAAWRVAGFDESLPRVVVSRSVMWVSFFIPLMLLLHKFRLFEMRTLAAERAATARLAGEVSKRKAAHESLARAAAERERLEREIARVGDEERRRLGHDLHDGVSQQLTGALLRCTALEDRLRRECPAAAPDARALGALVESAMDEVQEVARSLCPVDMGPEALGPALGALARHVEDKFAVRCDYREEAEVVLPDREQVLHLYMIAQEAANNAGKHARARRIAITLAAEDHSVLLSVADDGAGLSRRPSGRGLGLRIMAYRAETLGGTLTLECPAQGGTRVVCRVPVAGASDS